MSASPLVLAVPVFNGERFLAETLTSLHAQGANVRWWLQDGASKDRTVELARSFARPGDTIFSEPDTGQAEALNRAFHKMGGDIVGFLNADDTLLPGTAETVLRFFDEHPDIDLVCGEIDWMDAESNITGHHAGRINSLAEVLDIYGVWWAGRQWVQPEVFFRRSLWEKAGGFTSTWQIAFDYEFWVRCFRAGARVAHLPITFTRFRFHPAQKSTASARAADEIRAIVRHHLDDGAPLSGTRRWALEAQLSYDLYQGRTEDRSSFPAALLRNPQWLLAPPARARARAACARLFPGDTKRA